MCQKSKNFVLISSTSQRSREQGHLTRKRRGEEVWSFKTKENVGGMQLRECGDLEPLKPHSSPWSWAAVRVVPVSGCFSSAIYSWSGVSVSRQKVSSHQDWGFCQESMRREKGGEPGNRLRHDRRQWLSWDVNQVKMKHTPLIWNREARPVPSTLPLCGVFLDLKWVFPSFPAQHTTKSSFLAHWNPSTEAVWTVLPKQQMVPGEHIHAQVLTMMMVDTLATGIRWGCQGLWSDADVPTY